MYQRIPSQWLKHLDFMVLDIICMEAAFLAACALIEQSMLSSQDKIYSNMAVILLLLNIVVVFFCESYKGILRRGYYKEFIAAVKQALYILACFLILIFLGGTVQQYSRGVLVAFWAIYVILSYAMRILLKKYVLSHRQTKRKRLKMYLVTESHMAEEVIACFLRNNYSDLELESVAVIDQDLTGTKISGVPVTGSKQNMMEYIQLQWIDAVFFNCSAGCSISELVKDCTDMGFTVYLRLQEMEGYGGYQSIERLGGFEVLSCNTNPMSMRDACVKRMIDVAGALLGCTAVLFLTVILCPVIKIKSPGPLFFSQIRVGRNGKNFKMYKFRSMDMDAEERKKELQDMNKMKDGMMFKIDDDPRIIRGIGQFIRRTSIDEFPQFFNVLKGDMSLVGTRPPTLDEWERYKPHHRKRLIMKPGITGLWQVSGRNQITEFEQVVQLDLQYMRNWTLGGDFKILLKTIIAVLRRDGAV